MNHKKEQKQSRLETVAIHAGELKDAFGAHVAPIYQTSTYTFDGMKDVERYVSGEADSYIYSRGKNPSRKALAAKLAALEGYTLIQEGRADGQEGTAVVAEIFCTGMAAITAALLGSAQAGDHVIAQDVLYGSADALIAQILPQYGISTSRVKGLQAEALAQELEARPNARVVYLETPANPTMTLVDMAAVVEVAHAHGARVIVDNTFATPVLQRPMEFGVDVVVHSTTKYIGGHGVILGGAVVTQDVDFMNEKIANLVAFMGGAPSPFDCWLTNLGLKTLPLRVRQICANAGQVALFLEDHPKVSAVYYPGLESFPQHELACRQMDDFGGMLAFDVRGGYGGACRLLDGVRTCALAVSLGNLDTLIEHPASMTHRTVPAEVLEQIGVGQGLIRLSVGLEAAEDIIADLDEALAGV